MISTVDRARDKQEIIDRLRKTTSKPFDAMKWLRRYVLCDLADSFYYITTICDANDTTRDYCAILTSGVQWYMLCASLVIRLSNYLDLPMTYGTRMKPVEGMTYRTEYPDERGKYLHDFIDAVYSTYLDAIKSKVDKKFSKLMKGIHDDCCFSSGTGCDHNDYFINWILADQNNKGISFHLKDKIKTEHYMGLIRCEIDSFENPNIRAILWGLLRSKCKTLFTLYKQLEGSGYPEEILSQFDQPKEVDIKVEYMDLMLYMPFLPCEENNLEFAARASYLLNYPHLRDYQHKLLSRKAGALYQFYHDKDLGKMIESVLMCHFDRILPEIIAGIRDLHQEIVAYRGLLLTHGYTSDILDPIMNRIKTHIDEQFVGEMWTSLESQGFNGYNVSSIGRLKENQHIVKAHADTHGYCYYNLKQPDGYKQIAGHRLVALGFIHNQNPLIRTTVDHIDGSKNNNRAPNLRWATHMEQSLNTFKLLIR